LIRKVIFLGYAKSFLGYSKWNRSLEFESGDGKKRPQLQVQSDKPGCYIISGRTKVFREFSTDFSIYVEIRTSASRQRVTEPCINQGSDGCGGLGSCLYCHTCNNLDSKIGVKAELLENGKKLDCKTRLTPGIYDNIQLAFCLPEMEEILKSHGLSQKSLLSLVEGDDFIRKFGIFATIYIFNTDVSKLMQAQSRIIEVHNDRNKALFKGEPLPSELYWSLPFNLMIKNEKSYSACHIIHCNIDINTQ
uniref:Integrin_alpha2 domain-containing protein n=1 Tax=Elaeophora elaphi TaxID=1147741 RepID=A0A0R3S771_9BILA